MAKWFNDRAEAFSKQVMKNVAGWEDTNSRIRKYLTPTSNVLEVGCGTGTTAIKLSENCAHILSTDIAENMVRIARERATAASVTNVTFQVADAATPPDGHFDVILALNVINVCEYPSSVMRALHSRLKPGGIIVTKIHALEFNWWQRVKLPVDQFLGNMPEFVHFLELADLVELHEKLGFEVLDRVKYDKPMHRLVIARKKA